MLYLRHLEATFKYWIGRLVFRRRCKMLNWVDDRLAITDLAGVTLVDDLRKQGVEFVIDVRVHFHPHHILGEEYPDKTIWKFANDILTLSERAKVVVHCIGGMDRSPFVAMLYYKLKHGCDYREAYDHIKKARPQTIEHWEWVEEVKYFK